MIFNSFEFILVFLPAVGIVSCVIPRSYRAAWLALASLVFYGRAAGLDASSWLYGLLFPFFIAANYFLGRRLGDPQTPVGRRLLLGVGLLFNVGWWLVLKTHLPARLGVLTETAIAVGLGFYVLRAIGYLLDLYHRRTPGAPGFLSFFLYLAFFAHLPSGPITPWKWFSHHLGEAIQSGSRAHWSEGFYLFSIGMLKKAIADTIGVQINPVIDAGGPLGLATSWMVLFAYSAQIYFDFAGYTDMALGAGRLVGVRLPPNFDRPYLKRNPIEFWNAWHITLSHWLRDYVFTPLGRFCFSLSALKRSPMTIAALCYLITFLLCGAWHGLQSTFLLWGLYHGVGLSGCKLYGEFARKHFSSAYYAFMFQTRLGHGLAVAATFLFVSVGWVFFRSQTPAQAVSWLKGLTGGYGHAGMTLAPDVVLGVAGLAVFSIVLSRMRWQVEHLAYWQKIALTSNFWLILFYYFVAEDNGVAPFIYNVF